MTDDIAPDRTTTRPFIRLLAERLDLSLAAATEVYDAFIGIVHEELLAGREVVLYKFGRFYVQERLGHPVQFGEPGQTVASYSAPRFKASENFRRELRENEER